MPYQLSDFVFNCFQSFVLGVIQGITEFLPISSTAHLKIVPHLIGWDDPGVSISASLQLGSSLAILIYFRKEISSITNSFFSIFRKRKFFKDENTKLAINIFIANIPIFIFGLIIKLFWPNFSNSVFRGLFSIAIVSIAMAIFLALSEIYSKRKKAIKEINTIDVLFLGLSQALAVIPGVSRSGITLTSLLFSGLKRDAAARLSFLVGIPAILISGLVEFLSIYETSTGLDIFPILIGILSSFFSSIIAIDFLLGFLARNNTFIFVYYRLALGIFILSVL
tara:strand:+ start:122 stop:961 length:840 start_codon:yes stop_codon:yes gene_type:complete